MTLLKNKFKIFRSIVNKGDYHLIDDEDVAPTVVVPFHSWYGYYYNMYDEVKRVELYYKCEYALESKDERAKELAEWISEVCDVKQGNVTNALNRPTGGIKRTAYRTSDGNANLGVYSFL